MPENYTPYGPEWEKEVMKMPKKAIIQLYKNQCIQRKRLEDWKESAMKVWPDMQAIGKELGVSLGDTVHDKILPEIKRLKALLKKP